MVLYCFIYVCFCGFVAFLCVCLYLEGWTKPPVGVEALKYTNPGKVDKTKRMLLLGFLGFLAKFRRSFGGVFAWFLPFDTVQKWM